MSGEPRTYQPLTREHLDRLAEISRRDRESLFERLPHYRPLRDRVLTVALCQGGAMHFLHRQCGVKDLDVWTLYSATPEAHYHPLRRGYAKFGPSELVGWTERVDLLGRSLPYPIGVNPAEVWRDWLGASARRLAARADLRPRGSAEHLSRKAVVLLEPVEKRGEAVYDADAGAARTDHD